MSSILRILISYGIAFIVLPFVKSFSFQIPFGNSPSSSDKVLSEIVFGQGQITLTRPPEIFFHRNSKTSEILK